MKLPKTNCEGCKARDRINKRLAERVDVLEGRKTAEPVKVLPFERPESHPLTKIRFPRLGANSK